MKYNTSTIERVRELYEIHYSCNDIAEIVGITPTEVKICVILGDGQLRGRGTNLHKYYRHRERLSKLMRENKSNIFIMSALDISPNTLRKYKKLLENETEHI